MKTLTIAGKEYNRVRKIGSGTFVWSYLLDNQRVLILEKTHHNKKRDYAKECLALFTDQNIKHIPKIDYLGEIYYCGYYCNAYIMPYYKRLTGKARKQYEEIQKLFDLLYPYFLRQRSQKRLYDFIVEMGEYIKRLFPEIGVAYFEIMGNLADIENCNFDCHSGNFRQDDNGNLILLDIFCNTEAIRDWT